MIVCLDEVVREQMKSSKFIADVVDGGIYCIDEPVIKIVCPRIVFEEVSNVPAGFSDNDEEQCSITYRFFIYDKKNDVVLQIAREVEKKLKEYGFVRRSTTNLSDDCPKGEYGKELVMQIII